MSETWTDDEPAVLTTGRLSTRATPAATGHVERAKLARLGLASRITAQADPQGDEGRMLAHIYASTPTTILRSGALAEHCGLTDHRADEVLDLLVSRGLISPGAVTTRVSIVGPLLAERCADGVFR